jgi:uncharacterized protein (TIGR02246 family)
MEREEQAIRNLIVTWLAASKSGEMKTVLSLMANDVVFLVPGQAPMRGKSAFAATQDALREFDLDATSEVQEIKVFGESAYCWTKLTIVVTPRKGGAAIKRSGNTLSILKKQGGEWLLFRDANMLSVVQEWGKWRPTNTFQVASLSVPRLNEDVARANWRCTQ